MIEVAFACTEDISHLTPAEVTSLKSELDHDIWFRDDWYITGNITGNMLTVSGTCQVDDYSYAAPDVAYELECLLGKFNIDADVAAKRIINDVDYIPF